MRPNPFLRDLAVLVTGEITTRLISFGAITYLARRLGADGLGLITFAGALVSYVTLGANFGLDLYGTREVARRPERIAATAFTIQTLRLVLAAVWYALLGAAALLLPLSQRDRPIVLLYGLMLFPVAANPSWAFRGIERMAIVAVAGVLGQLVLFAGVLLWVTDRAQLARVALTYVAADVATTLLLLIPFVRRFGVAWSTPGRVSWTESLRAASPLFMATAARALGLNVDILALKFYVSDSSVGLYSASSRVLLFLLGVSGSYFANLYPRLARAGTGAASSLQVLLVRSVRLTAIATVPVAVGGVVLAEELMTAVFGAEYAGAAAPFRLHIIALVTSVLAGNFRTALVALDRGGREARVVAHGALLNVVLNLVLVPWLGPVGAAAAFLAGESLILLLARRALRPLLGTERLVAHLLRPLGAAVAMAGVVVAMGPTPVLVRVGGGATVYALALLALRGTSLDELRRLLVRPGGRS